jgi:hypothetical protein
LKQWLKTLAVTRMRMDRKPHIGEYDMNATEEKSQQINGLEEMPSSVRDSLSVNASGRYSKSDTPLTQVRSLDVLARHLTRIRPLYSREKQGHISNLIKKMRQYENEANPAVRAWLETSMAESVAAVLTEEL